MSQAVVKKNNGKSRPKKLKVVAKNGGKNISSFPAVISSEVKKALNDARQTAVRNTVVTEISKYLQEGAKTKPDKVRKIDFRALTKYANPAVDTVTADIGQFNPDIIDVTTYELMRKDPQLAAGLAMIKMPLMALPWRIESDSEDVEKFCEHALRIVWKTLMKSMLTAVDFGFAAHEKVWQRKDILVQSIKRSGDGDDGEKVRKKTHFKGDAVIYKEFKPMYPSSVLMKFEDDVFIGIEQTGVFGMSVKDPPKIEARKSFVFTHDKEFGNLFGRSRLKPAYKIWYWKELMYQFMMQYYERRGSPPIIVTAPPGESVDGAGTIKDNLVVALDLGASFINNSTGALPYEESSSGRENMWSVDYLLDDRRGTMFIDVINHLDAKSFLALWVPERLGEHQSGGSFAETNIIVDLFLLSEKALITEIEDHVNKFILPQLVEFNFVKSKRSPAYLKMDQLDWNRRLAIKEIFIEMLRNVDTMVQAGIAPRVMPALEKMAGILEIPVETFDEAVKISDKMPKQEPAANTSDRRDNPTVDKNGKIIPLPKRTAPRRKSDSARTENRRTVKPGTKPTEQARARAQEDKIETIMLAEFIPDNFDFGIGPGAKSRKFLIKEAHAEEGLHRIKKALFRLVLWSNREFIPGFNTLDYIHMSRAIEKLSGHLADIIIEAMGQSVGR